MSSKRSSTAGRPFEFRLTYEEKELLRALAWLEGTSMSEYVRRALQSYPEKPKTARVPRLTKRKSKPTGEVS